jgi:hypothetical protein
VWRHRWITVGRKIAIVRGLPGVGKTLAARLAHDWGGPTSISGIAAGSMGITGAEARLKAVLIGRGGVLGIGGLREE